MWIRNKTNEFHPAVVPTTITPSSWPQSFCFLPVSSKSFQGFIFSWAHRMAKHQQTCLTEVVDLGWVSDPHGIPCVPSSPLSCCWAGQIWALGKPKMIPSERDAPGCCYESWRWNEEAPPIAPDHVVPIAPVAVFFWGEGERGEHSCSNGWGECARF